MWPLIVRIKRSAQTNTPAGPELTARRDTVQRPGNVQCNTRDSFIFDDHHHNSNNPSTGRFAPIFVHLHVYFSDDLVETKQTLHESGFIVQH